MSSAALDSSYLALAARGAAPARTDVLAALVWSPQHLILVLLTAVAALLAALVALLLVHRARSRRREQELQRLQHDLRESRRGLEAAQARARLGTWEYFPDRDRGTWSPFMYQVFHREPALGAPGREEFLQMIHPEDRALVEAAFDDVRQREEPTRVDFRTNPAGGPVRYLSSSAEWVRTTTGAAEHLAGTTLDITDRKRIEEELRRSRQLLDGIRLAQTQFIADGGSEAIFDGLLAMLLAITDSEYGFLGEVLYADAGKPYLQMRAISKTASSEEGRAFAEKHAPAGWQFFNMETLFGQVITTGDVVVSADAPTDPRRGGPPEGHPPLRAFLGVPFRQGERLVGMAGIANRPGGYDQELVKLLEPFVTTCANLIEGYRNIRRRREAEETLRESEERWRTVVDNVPDFILVIDRDYRISFINHIRPGYDPQQVYGSDVLDYLGDDYREPYRACLERAFRGESPVLEMIGRGAPGSWSWYMTRMAPVRKNGEVVAALLVATDITERKKTEESMAASLREKEALLKEIHHRVKNNLQIILSLLNLQAAHAADPTVTRVFAETRNRVRSMALLHETLYQSESLARIDLPRYVTRLCQQLFGSYGADGGRIGLSLDVREKHLDLDRAIPCGLIINELVSNALKYAFPDGRAGTVRVEVSCADGLCLLRVGDDGVGLPADLDWRAAGSLGLRLVSDLTRQLGGTIALEPQPGTVFRIEFKLQGGRAPERPTDRDANPWWQRQDCPGMRSR